jgi:hypothetical protein
MGMRNTTGMALCALLLATPLFSQIDLSGDWAPLYHEDGPERLPGPELGDYAGLPLNEAGRMRANSYDGDRISVVQEYQCRPHSSDYGLRGLGNLRVWRQVEDATQRTIAFHTRMLAYDNERTIWLDGRPHPPEGAVHTWQGFSTGVFEGNMLTVTTTHLKPGYTRRNGVPSSAKRKITEHWTRHGNYLTVTVYVDDPVFLAEPLVRSQSWFLDPGQQMGLYPCEPAPEVPRPVGTVPNHLPGKNPFLKEVPEWYGLPYEAVQGGPETMYPEYRKKMKDLPTPKAPEKCDRFCFCISLFDCPLHQPAPAGARR